MTTRLRLIQRGQLRLDPASRLNPSKEDPEEAESHRLVINAKLVDEAVKRCETHVLLVETEDARSNLPSLYNDLWDACLCHKKVSLDCRVVTPELPSVKRVASSAQAPIFSAESLADVVLDEAAMAYFLFDNPRQALPKLPVVALGGTFDRLHNGGLLP